MKKVVIHTDGGCHGNPGPGAWAATLTFGTTTRELSGGEAATTNNRMELQAAIAALSALKEPCEVDLFTDSTYVKNGITEWLTRWKANNWRTRAKRPVRNADLWRELDSAAMPHRVEWKWVKGHAGHAQNERCDLLANEAIVAIKAKFSTEELRTALAKFALEQEPQPAREETLELGI